MDAQLTSGGPQRAATVQLVPPRALGATGHVFTRQRCDGGWHRTRGALAAAAVITLAASCAVAAAQPQTLQDVAPPVARTQTLTPAAAAIAAPELSALSSVTALPLEKRAAAASSAAQFSLHDLMFRGVINWGGYKFTYYSQQVLPGGGLQIPGRHVNQDGFVSDGAGFIVLAGDAPLGTVFDTPFGARGKIYDRGTVGNHLDVYTR